MQPLDARQRRLDQIIDRRPKNFGCGARMRASITGRSIGISIAAVISPTN
jgi:hypothetical protein